MCIFSKVNQKYLATKKLKLSSESLENCTTFDAGILNSHFSLLFKKQKWEEKKIYLKHSTTRQAPSVTPIQKPLGQGSSLAPLRTTFDTWLPLTPLNLLKVPTEIP